MPFSCIPFFACNRQIDVLDRRQCNLQSVPNDIDRNARTLEEAYLDCNHIKDLEKPLFRCRKLKTLSLSENEIIRVPTDIANLICLEELNLKGNDVSDLPEEIKECTQLKILDLSSNPITRLPPTITLLTSMTHLGLNDISLTQMPLDIGHLRNLRSLEVRENLLRTIPPSISQLTQLQRLDLGHNELDDLPSEIGLLSNLQELYVDQNDLEALPESIVQCRSLQQLDVSENKLMVLPDDIGDLEQLNDLTVSHNCLQVLPTSVGHLKKLAILKVDRNAITQLTPAVGSCTALSELYLTENLLTEVPTSLGNLKALRTLNLDKNQLKEIPSTIGGCISLSVLSLRDNLLEQLPLEIGRLENLRVLDVCNNRLNFLPFTINVLFNLQALWLSESQSQAMLKLQTDQDPRTGIKVLTCYLLPQSTSHPAERAPPNRSFVGGPKVHFGSDLEETREDEEVQEAVGVFSRQDTPHPKPHSHAPKFKKQSIDGHIIHHDDDSPSHPPVLTLSSSRKRSSDDSSVHATSPVGASAAAAGANAPRSALKHPSVSSPASSPPGDQNVERIMERVAERRSTMTSPSGAETLKIEIRRDANGGLGLSIAGGLESTPYKNDDSGLFVSKLAEGGPAQLAGLKVGDKLLRVNNTDVLNVRHQVAVASMQDAKDVVELTVLREPNEPIPLSSYVASPNQSLDMSFMSETADSSSSTKETISTAIRRDLDGSPGFSVAGGKGASTGDPIVISYLTPGGAAERDGKLRVGDRVLSINGTNMRGARHDQAVALLTSFSSNEIYLVVQRDRPGTPASASLQVAPSSTKSAPAARSPPAVAPRQSPQQACGFGDSSWDGKTEEVDLVRENHSLGLSIVGGSDHSSHPFGVNAPGVFISKITANSPAARSQKLRIGDRILFVNDVDVRNAKHQTAVEALKRSEPTVRLRVTHEPQPSGLREVILRRSCGEPLGLRICGGINSPPANPLDKTDEGIFVEKVERGGAAAGSSLAPGVRILEVNDESLLGCSQEEAARVLRRSGETVRLLVCDAFTSSPSMSCSRLSGSSERHQTVSASPSPAIAHFPQVGSPNASASALVRDGICVSLLDDGPLATSSPIPPPLVHQPVRPSTSSSSPLPLAPPPPRAATSPSGAVRSVPPPVAPKPKINPKQNGVTHESVPLASLDDQLESEPAAGSSQVSTPSTPNSNPERMAFSSKLKKFEREIEIKRPSPLPSSSAPLLPVP
uniref:Protein lap1 n=1 Tax=Ascaris suum TaxID=6253 RepID=F1KS12_ASCSU